GGGAGGGLTAQLASSTTTVQDSRLIQADRLRAGDVGILMVLVIVAPSDPIANPDRNCCALD
ncbi:hypothetical protein, partial [Limnohabitans sp.]|uniref:hypothetical protein n=1 Tax=Limnohabitans sp. TaxID=1907725 RepID=UPI00391B064F